MSEDWKPGDLALCVNTGQPRRLYNDGIIRSATAGKRLRLGKTYHVTSVSTVSLKGYAAEGLLFLTLAEDVPGKMAGSWRFINVTPLEADEYDREVIGLMVGEPVA